MQTASKKAPWHLWVVGVIAVLFNSIGVIDFVMSRIQGPAYLVSAGMTPEQVAHYQQLPAWMMFVWALGVFSAFAASVLLLRRKSAAPIFVLSLAAFLLSQFHTYVLTNGGSFMGQQMAITSVVIAGVAAVIQSVCVLGEEGFYLALMASGGFDNSRTAWLRTRLL